MFNATPDQLNDWPSPLTLTKIHFPPTAAVPGKRAWSKKALHVIGRRLPEARMRGLELGDAPALPVLTLSVESW